MNNLDKQYQDLLQSILDYGVEKQDRTGTGTKSIFGYTIRHNMRDGFPLLTTKKMAWKTMVTELIWFLRGDTNIKFLVDNGCHIWDGDAYKNYLKNFTPPECPPNLDVQPDYDEPMSKDMFIYCIKTNDEFANKWGELGPVYGKQWRSWGKDFKQIPNETGDGVYDITTTGIDQISNLINDLKTNPDSRRLMVNAWNVGELDQMVLPPCHYGFQVYTRELSEKERIILAGYDYENRGGIGWNMIKETVDMDNTIPRRAISLMWNQRSCDTFLGIPFNIASYGLLLEIIAKAVNMVPDELIGNLGDVHLYSNHIEQAKEQIGRELSLEERIELASKDPVFDPGDFGVGEQITDEHCHEICDSYSVPRKTREPFELPTLNMAKTDAFWNGFDVSLFGHLEPTDFIIENYQSHPTIKAPLSN
jgi:thymidylate synthase